VKSDRRQIGWLLGMAPIINLNMACIEQSTESAISTWENVIAFPTQVPAREASAIL
jgi:hypothetical protein